jgi:holo-[acyl-carrier protein] synthase
VTVERSLHSVPGIVGVGIDAVDVARFASVLERRPTLAGRLFTPSEQADAARSRRPAERLAARFAAKEAVAKALGVPAGLRWTDAEVVRERGGRPSLLTRGTVAAAASRLGVARWHLSLSHDAGAAVAMVMAEGPR